LNRKRELGRLLRKVEAAGAAPSRVPGSWPAHPVVYEINTWAWLQRLGRRASRPVTLATVPEEELERFSGERGFDAVWLMGVWRRSELSRREALNHPELSASFREVLPDFHDPDVVGSPYAVADYHVDPALGGNGELRILRQRLAARGLRLILDFVPNHLAADHPWVDLYPDRLLQTDTQEMARRPGDYFPHRSGGRNRIFAHGRDPNFPGWTDTVQIDFRRAETREAMALCLLEIAGRCDGVRCDMAMLPTRTVFSRTWGGAFDPPDAEFWPEALARVRERYPEFITIGEVYWDMEWELQQQGFDFTYDKRLYDLLLGNDPRSVKLRLDTNTAFQGRLTRFIENHDEARAASAFGPERVRPAAVISMTVPGMRLFHQGQLEGARLQLPIQLGRGPDEEPDPGLSSFFRRLVRALRHPVFHRGQWAQLTPQEEWFGNPTFRNIVAHRWILRGHRRLAVANLSAEPAQCFLPLNLSGLGGMNWRFQDLLGEANYVREGDDLVVRGLYLDLPAHGCHLFDLQQAGNESRGDNG